MIIDRVMHVILYVCITHMVYIYIYIYIYIYKTYCIGCPKRPWIYELNIQMTITNRKGI